MNQPSDTERAYRTCFSTDAGRLVLGDILANAGYFDCDVHSEGEIAVQNFARSILKKMGVFGSPEKIKPYVDKIMEL